MVAGARDPVAEGGRALAGEGGRPRPAELVGRGPAEEAGREAGNGKEVLPIVGGNTALPNGYGRSLGWMAAMLTPEAGAVLSCGSNIEA